MLSGKVEPTVKYLPSRIKVLTPDKIWETVGAGQF